MLSVKELKENYRNFSDSKINNIAKNDAHGLRKEVLAILKGEIEKRNLDTSLITWIESDVDRFEGIERKSIKMKIQNLKCPNCGKKKDRLYGFEINQVVSLIATFDTRKENILCKKCGRKKKLYAILITFFAGWWSRRGIFLTPLVIIKDTVNFFYLNRFSNQIIERLIDDNTGAIRFIGDDDETLLRIIKTRNKKNTPADDGYSLS